MSAARAQTMVSTHRIRRAAGVSLGTPWGTWGPAYDVRITRSGAYRAAVLLEPLTWIDPDGQVITIPAGFLSDGASLPPLTWWLLGGKLSLEWISAAIVHDYACVFHATHAAAWAAHSSDATTRFYRGLRADGMGAVRAQAARQAVSMFGPRWSP